MVDGLRDYGSVWRGIRAMRSGHAKPAQWSVRLLLKPVLWYCLWTPIWHQGRGPYVSIGIGLIAIHRGY